MKFTASGPMRHFIFHSTIYSFIKKIMKHLLSAQVLGIQRYDTDPTLGKLVIQQLKVSRIQCVEQVPVAHVNRSHEVLKQ